MICSKIAYSRLLLQKQILADLQIYIQEVLAIRGFLGKWKSANYKTANFKVPHIWVSMSPDIVLFPFYNANWQLFINFIWKSSHFLAFLTLKSWEFLQNAGILRVLKNRELQIREIQGRELQGLPVFVCFLIHVAWKTSSAWVKWGTYT